MANELIAVAINNGMNLLEESLKELEKISNINKTVTTNFLTEINDLRTKLNSTYDSQKQVNGTETPNKQSASLPTTILKKILNFFTKVANWFESIAKKNHKADSKEILNAVINVGNQKTNVKEVLDSIINIGKRIETEIKNNTKVQQSRLTNVQNLPQQTAMNNAKIGNQMGSNTKQQAQPTTLSKPPSPILPSQISGIKEVSNRSKKDEGVYATIGRLTPKLNHAKDNNLSTISNNLTDQDNVASKLANRNSTNLTGGANKSSHNKINPIHKEVGRDSLQQPQPSIPSPPPPPPLPPTKSGNSVRATAADLLDSQQQANIPNLPANLLDEIKNRKELNKVNISPKAANKLSPTAQKMSNKIKYIPTPKLELEGDSSWNDEQESKKKQLPSVKDNKIEGNSLSPDQNSSQKVGNSKHKDLVNTTRTRSKNSHRSR